MLCTVYVYVCMFTLLCQWKRLHKAVFWGTLAYTMTVEPKQIHNLAKICPIAYVALLAWWWKILPQQLGPSPSAQMAMLSSGVQENRISLSSVAVN